MNTKTITSKKQASKLEDETWVEMMQKSVDDMKNGRLVVIRPHPTK